MSGARLDFAKALEQTLTEVSSLAVCLYIASQCVTASPYYAGSPPPRQSRRANIGIPPERYYDPKQKLLAVKYKKRDRDA
ncbi:hypothetical protein N7497_011524 [Penicillium chrysogenum]|nr:hypothetical protein N7497_011524 [Penicillium chrysogenum]